MSLRLFTVVINLLSPDLAFLKRH